MIKIFAVIVARDVPENEYRVLRRAICNEFPWAYVEEIGDRKQTDLRISRHDDNNITMNSRIALLMFVKGVRAGLSRVQWRLDEEF